MRKKLSTHLSFIFIFCLIFILNLFEACSSPPRKDSVRKSPDYYQSITKVKRIGIIGDVSVATSSSFSNEIYFSIENSKTTETLMLESTQNYLQEKGYEVVFKYSPFVGGAFISEKPYKILPVDGEDISDKYPPFYTEEALNANIKYLNALRTVMTNSFKNIKTIQLTGSTPSDYYLNGKDVKESLKLIQEQTKTDFLIVLIGDGVHISSGTMFAKRVGQFMLSFATAMAGAAIAIPIDKPYINTWVALIDLNNGEMIWTNRNLITESPLNKSIYQKSFSQRTNANTAPSEWADELFFHFKNNKDK